MCLAAFLRTLTTHILVSILYIFKLGVVLFCILNCSILYNIFQIVQFLLLPLPEINMAFNGNNKRCSFFNKYKTRYLSIAYKVEHSTVRYNPHTRYGWTEEAQKPQNVDKNICRMLMVDGLLWDMIINFYFLIQCVFYRIFYAHLSSS